MRPTHVAGFAFDSDGCVALIEKLKPDWQKGRLNGIGGSVETGESSYDAMVREFEEEAGLTVKSWERFCTIQDGPEVRVDFYRAFDVDLTDIKSLTQEQVVVVPHVLLPEKVLTNLNWLIPLALDSGPDGRTLVTYGPQEAQKCTRRLT